MAQRAAARRDDPAVPPLEHGLDVFHTAMEAQRVLARRWRGVEAAWEQAERADAKVAGAKRQGIDARGLAGAGRGRMAAGDRGLRGGRAARIGLVPRPPVLELFDADGRLNDRTRAAAEIAMGAERCRRPRVAAVLGDTVRASSAVECMISVLRMQQSRHRRMT